MRIPISEHHKDQLLSTLMYHLPMEQRRHLIVEVPQAYNAYCQANGGSDPVVEVRRTSDGTVV